MTDDKPEPPKLMIGKYEAKSIADTVNRLSLLLWGQSGCGKTSLAASAPKDILYVMFDDNGAASLGGASGITIVDLSDAPNSMVMDFREEDGIFFKGLYQLLQTNPRFKTVVFDSVTTFSEKAMIHGVHVAKSTPKGQAQGVTLEDPGYAGYGNKNTWVKLLVRNALRVTRAAGVNCILICHEDKPDKDTKGNAIAYSILLGSSLAQQAPIDLSEVWWMYDTGTERRVVLRNAKLRSPMKTRMFDTNTGIEFTVKYDARKDAGPGLRDWIADWSKSGYQKIPVPK